MMFVGVGGVVTSVHDLVLLPQVSQPPQHLPTTQQRRSSSRTNPFQRNRSPPPATGSYRYADFSKNLLRDSPGFL